MGGLLDLLGIVAALGTMGLLPAFIAHAKGRSFGPWWLFGSLLLIPALVMALVVRRGDTAPTWGRWGLVSSPRVALRNAPIFIAINLLAVTSHNQAVKTVAIIGACGLLSIVFGRLVGRAEGRGTSSS